MVKKIIKSPPPSNEPVPFPSLSSPTNSNTQQNNQPRVPTPIQSRIPTPYNSSMVLPPITPPVPPASPSVQFISTTNVNIPENTPESYQIRRIELE